VLELTTYGREYHSLQDKLDSQRLGFDESSRVREGLLKKSATKTIELQISRSQFHPLHIENGKVSQCKLKLQSF
jgi:hypothetical protein